MPLLEGSQAPDFLLKDQNNQEVRLTTLHGRTSVLLVFYPLTFTGTCQGELTELQDSLSWYAAAGVQPLAVSVDSPYAHKVWAIQQGYDFPLLADFWPHGDVARAYGVLDETKGVAGRGTFLIDTAGTIRFAELATPGARRDQTVWRAAVAALNPGDRAG